MCWSILNTKGAALPDIGRGIAGHLVGMVKQRYHDYLYIEVMPEESKNATFYEKHGFHIMEDGVAMQICNPGERH